MPTARQLDNPGEEAPMIEQEPPMLDFAADDALTGFRLQRLEVFNWGTFDNASGRSIPTAATACSPATSARASPPWSMRSPRCSCPRQRIAYNKAAGAEQANARLRSYVLGYYKTERSESGVGAANRSPCATPTATRSSSASSTTRATTRRSPCARSSG